MPNKWKVTIRGLRKEILLAEDSDQGAIDLGRTIIKITERNKYKKYFEDFEYQQGWDLDEFGSVMNKEELNNLLSEFYDYCDRNGIWIDVE